MSKEDLCAGIIKNSKQRQTSQLKKLLLKSDDELNLVEDMRQYMRRRAELEHSYYEEHLKLTNEYLTKKSPKEDRTWHKAWYSILEEFKNQYQQRESFSNFLKDEISNSIKVEYEEKKKNFSKLSDYTKKLQYSLHQSYEELSRVKSLYDQCERDAQKALQKFEETQKPGTLRRIFNDQKRLVDEARKKHKNASQKAQEARNDYLLVLEATNTHHQEYYQTILPYMMKKMDGSFFDQVQNRFNKVCQQEVSNANQTIEIMDKIVRLASSINRDTDNMEFLNENSGVFNMNASFTYEPYNNDQVAEVILDFVSKVSLSNKLARKKKHLSQVQAEIDKKNKEIEATIKMTQVYEATPEFGKSSHTNEELDNLYLSLEELEVEKKKLLSVIRKLEEIGVEVINPAGTIKEKKLKKIIALYDFSSDDPSNLVFKTNDIISVIEDGEEWIKGELNGQVGLVPATYVKPYDSNQSKKSGVKRTAKALYDFDGKDEGDLVFRAGDIIEILSKDDEWWEGSLNGKVGAFPALFVQEDEESVENDSSGTLQTQSSGGSSKLMDLFNDPNAAPATTMQRTKSVRESKVIDNKRDSIIPPAATSTGDRVQALYDYTAKFDGELTFKKGDIIMVTNKNIGSAAWWEGTINGKVGQFPKSYVREIPSQAQPSQVVQPPLPVKPAQPKVLRVKALYDYAPQQEDELSIRQGDIIEVINNPANSDWWEGRLNGKVGHFPKTYVSDV